MMFKNTTFNRITARKEESALELRPRILINIKPQTATYPSHSSKFALGNCRSLRNKIPYICDCVLSEKLDIFVLTESWLNGNARDTTTLARTLQIICLTINFFKSLEPIVEEDQVCVILLKLKVITLIKFRSTS